MSFRDWLDTLPGLERELVIANGYCLALSDEFDTLHERPERLARRKEWIREEQGASLEKHDGGPFNW